jgi:hypothetical protein
MGNDLRNVSSAPLGEGRSSNQFDIPEQRAGKRI